MSSIIGQLFDGKISVYEHLRPPDPDYAEARHNVVELETNLREKLSPDLQKKLDEFCDKKDIATSLLIQQSFSDGFKLAAKLMLEIYED